MRFAVSRSSNRGSSQPVDGAVWDYFPRVPETVVHSKKGWFIEIGSLEELMAFMHEHGKLIISARDPGDVVKGIEFPFIEIYDDYRE